MMGRNCWRAAKIASPQTQATAVWKRPIRSVARRPGYREAEAGRVWADLIETDRMCRSYRYLAQRLDRAGDLLQIGPLGAASGAFVFLLSQFPA